MMNRLQIQGNPIEQALSHRVGALLDDAWSDPLVGGTPPNPHFEAAVRFLLGCELAIRFGRDSCLAAAVGEVDPEALQVGVDKVSAVLRPWELCAPEPDFNAIYSLTFAWTQVMGMGPTPDVIAHAAFAVPFHVDGIERLNGFVESCLAQFEKFGDWFLSGYVKVHRWFDEACPNGPDPRMDSLAVILSAPYSPHPVERSFMSAVLASRPDMPGVARCRDFGEFMLEAFDWARKFPDRFPEPHARLIEEIEADPVGPGMDMLVRTYRYWFGDCESSEWRSGLLKTLSRYVPTVVAGDKTLTPWSLEPSAFRSAVDFAAWAGITAAYLERDGGL